ncbi:TPA: oligosaccharide flippase family protein [Vibrio parahaemolyticus]|nr:oligosaccharide flippase family protein [Vibrio parahaemolyticus]HCH6295779.1 oligosaccharide flippase family protein [Vibrio parahaemolyticus]
MNKIIYLFGTVVFAFSQWFIVWVISNKGGHEMVGKYSLYLSIISFIAIFFNLGLRNYIPSDINGKFKSNSYLSLKITSLSFFIVLGTLISFVSDNSLLFFSILLIKFCDSISDFLYALFVKNEEAYLFGYSQILKLVMLILMSCLYFYMSYNVEIYLISVFLCLLFIVFIFDVNKAHVDFKELKIKTRNEYKNIIYNSLPLAISSFIISLSVFIPRYFLDILFSSEAVARFTYITYYSVFFSMVVTSILQVRLPKISRDASKTTDFSYHKDSVIIGSGYSVFLIVFFYFISNPISSYIYNIEPYSSLTLILMSVYSILTLINAYFNIILVAQSKGGYMMRVYILSMVILVVFCYLGGRVLEENGIYLSICFSSLIQAILMFHYLKRERV